ncbi:MAG: DUF262 domain-containing protein [Caldilineaceae bacterium]|nr:DUF262 domain-containing protein [Caldilineaceae bacterium]
MNVASFDSKKRGIDEMLNEVSTGKMQLPDFQRGWVWDDHHIQDLITSVSLSFPIGAIMTLETGGEDVNFKPRPIEGAEKSIRHKEPETLILDGQQRLTSLFQALKAGKVVETKDTRGNTIRRWYYLDIKQCIDSSVDRGEAVHSIPEDRVVKTFRSEVIRDLSSPEKEYAEDMFPLRKVFKSAAWRLGYFKYWGFDRSDKIELYTIFEEEVIKRFLGYQVPIIELDKETPKEAVCTVFEKVNTGNVPLTVFELLTASFSAEGYRLRDDWTGRERRLKNAHPALRGMESTLFLQALTLLATRSRGGAVSCRRRDILRLEAKEYERWADPIEEGFKKAARFLHGQKIFNSRDLPYAPQLVPLSAILTELGDAADTEGVRQKIARWFWCGLLGEMYGGTTETRFALDLVDVIEWVCGSVEIPRTIQDANFQANRLLTLRTRNSAAYKGLHALLMRDGSRDFLTGEPVEDQTFFEDNIDIHHIFPQSWCGKQAIDRDVYNSIINKTAISARTNRIIGGQPPSVYLPRLQKRSGIDDVSMNTLLSSHRISPDCLRNDDFSRFFADRAEGLLQGIEAAMGKVVTREESLFWLGAPIEEYDDGPTNWDENVG